MNTESESRILDRISEMEGKILRSQAPRWMSIPEAAAYMGVSERYFYKTLKYELTPVAFGKRLLFDREQIDTFMESHKVEIIKSAI